MIKVIKMLKHHIDEVVFIENESFTIPWSKNSFLREIEKNKDAIYFVAINNYTNQVLGYGGMWNIANEAHITNIAVSSKFRGRGIGSQILKKVIQVAKDNNLSGITLEVRASNEIAKKLYFKHGFILEGIRKEYYEDNREDALIMWKYL